MHYGNTVAQTLNTEELRRARESLDQAYQLYQLELRRFFAVNSRDPQSIDDLMQSVYMQMMKAQIQEAVRDPQRYLFQTAWNVLRFQNRGAAQQREQALHFDSKALDTLADPSNSLWIEDDTSTAIVQSDTERLLKQLPRVCQVVLIRQYRDKKSYKEIAGELGVTVHTVKKYLTRALNHFSEYFDEAGQDS